MINVRRLLDEANAYFINKDYDQALFTYSQLVSQYPNINYMLFFVISQVKMKPKLFHCLTTSLFQKMKT